MIKENKSDQGLVVSSLSKSWAEHKVLDAVSFEQSLGTIFGLAGDNGAGKSTLLKILASVLSRDGGQVHFQGVSLDQRTHWRALTGYVPQDLALDERLKVRETLLFWAAARGFSLSERKRFLELAASDPLISGFLEKPIRECSGGMARRVSLIVGLLGDPLLVLLDEPFAGADRHSRQLILERLDLLRQRGRTILVSSHEEDILETLCEHVLYLEKAELSAAVVKKS
ncbi:MAG TPA: ABC transporter ATP-binding protein [Fastidiosipila sp.]|nr:ABC transporter ATP-binding protein [Fastidiosipila sp.]